VTDQRRRRTKAPGVTSTDEPQMNENEKRPAERDDPGRGAQGGASEPAPDADGQSAAADDADSGRLWQREGALGRLADQ